MHGRPGVPRGASPSADSRDIVKVVLGLIATLSALVLGLLIASARSSFDVVNHGLKEMAAKVILIDRVLARWWTA
jgi:hypothetical protein